MTLQIQYLQVILLYCTCVTEDKMYLQLFIDLSVCPFTTVSRDKYDLCQQFRNQQVFQSFLKVQVKQCLKVPVSSSSFFVTLPRWSLCKHAYVPVNFRAAVGQSKLPSDRENEIQQILLTHFRWTNLPNEFSIRREFLRFWQIIAPTTLHLAW